MTYNMRKEGSNILERIQIQKERHITNREGAFNVAITGSRKRKT